MEETPIAKTQSTARKRPVAVTILFVLFCAGVPVWLVAIAGILIAGMGRLDSSVILAVATSLLILVLRGVGMVRLFMMKLDAWVPMAVALVIELPVVGLFLLKHRAAGRDISVDLISSAVGWVIAVAVIVYAYRLFNGAEETKTPKV